MCTLPSTLPTVRTGTIADLSLHSARAAYVTQGGQRLDYLPPQLDG
ncbi:hypothetical protein RSAG8_00401, partial [Rhizoctonia solani AG-8 WAC10335]